MATQTQLEPTRTELIDEGIELSYVHSKGLSAADTPVSTDDQSKNALGSFPATPERSATLASVADSVDPFGRPAELEHDAEAAAAALPPIDGGRQAWTFVLAATLLEFFVWGIGAASGTFVDYHLSSPESPLYGAPSALIAATSTLTTAGCYFSSFLFVGFLSNFPHRTTLFSVVTLFIAILGYIGASFLTTPAAVLALQGFVAGWGAGAFYTPALIWLPQWFDKRRSFATGILFLGSGIGGIVWPFAISGLLERIGFSWTMRVLALILGLLGLLIFYFMRPRIKPQRPQAHGSGGRRRRNVWRAVLPVHDKMVSTPVGIANSVLQFFQGAAFWSISYYLSPYATSLGLPRTTSTALLSTFNAATALSFVLTGKLCDMVPYAPFIIAVATSGSIVVGVGLGFARTAAPLFVFALLYGIINGGFPVIMSPAAREMAIMGQTEHSTIFVEIMAVRGLGGIVGPLVSAALYTGSGTSGAQTGSPAPWTESATYGSHGMGSVVIFATACTLVVSVIATAVIPLRKKWRATLR